MNTGSDIGNITAIACGEKTIITESRVQRYDREDNLRKSDVFSFDDELFTLNKGDFENNLIKYKKNNFMKLLFYTLSECTDDCINNVVIGIPAKQYQSEKRIKEFYEKLNENRIHTIGNKTIILNKLEIVPEGYGLKVLGYLNSYEKYKELVRNVPTIVIDMGGETTDLTLFDEALKFIKSENVKYGLLKIYEKARSFLEDTFEMDLLKADAKLYFDGDRDIHPEDIPEDIEDIEGYKREIVIDALRELLNSIKAYFPNIKQYNIILCDGGGEVIYDTFKQLYPQTILVPEIDVNAEGNKYLADLLWKDENERIELVEEVIKELNNLWNNKHIEKNRKILINLWNNKQGRSILEDLYNIRSVEEIEGFNAKKYIEDKYF